MHRILILLLIFAATQLVAADKPTSLSDARNAVEANMRSSEGKRFDEQFGADFINKHLGPFHDCKAAAGGRYEGLLDANQTRPRRGRSRSPVVSHDQAWILRERKASQRQIPAAAQTRLLGQRVPEIFPLRVPVRQVWCRRRYGALPRAFFQSSRCGPLRNPENPCTACAVHRRW